MGIQIGAKLDSGFEDPIGMLKDCHRRIEHFLHILCVVVEQAASRTLTDEEKAAIQAALNYFRTGGQRHNADEEESLFPRLRAESTSETLQELSGLENDHRDANDLHSAADTLYTAWIEFGLLSPDDEQRLLLIAKQLRHLYEEHIQVEEHVVFPMAAEMLDTRAIAAIGREFRARRE